jgi:hypothetical protein
MAHRSLELGAHRCEQFALWRRAREAYGLDSAVIQERPAPGAVRRGGDPPLEELLVISSARGKCRSLRHARVWRRPADGSF